MIKKTAAVIAAVLALPLLFGAKALACSEYVHFWMPVKEDKSRVISPESLFFCLKETFKTELKGFNGSVGVAFSPESEAKTMLSDKMSQAFKAMGGKSMFWASGNLADTLNVASKGNANSWLDVFNMSRITYFWRDVNPSPFSMLRTGEFDAARARIAVVSDKSEVLYIDEVPVIYLLEVDYLVPSWMSVGGIWLRRISFQGGSMKKRNEYTVSLQSSEELPFETDVNRYFYGSEINPNVSILTAAQALAAQQTQSQQPELEVQNQNQSQAQSPSQLEAQSQQPELEVQSQSQSQAQSPSQPKLEVQADLKAADESNE